MKSQKPTRVIGGTENDRILVKQAFKQGQLSQQKKDKEIVENYCEIACYKECFNTTQICQICKEIMNRIESQQGEIAISNPADKQQIQGGKE